MATTHKIFNANSSNISCIEDKSVQLIVTSPPYPMIEMWDDMFKKQSPNIETYFQTKVVLVIAAQITDAAERKAFLSSVRIFDGDDKEIELFLKRLK